MYKKVLYNVKTIKIMWGGGEWEGQYLNQKHSICIYKKNDQAGTEPSRDRAKISHLQNCRLQNSTSSPKGNDRSPENKHF